MASSSEGKSVSILNFEPFLEIQTWRNSVRCHIRHLPYQDSTTSNVSWPFEVFGGNPGDKSGENYHITLGSIFVKTKIIYCLKLLVDQVLHDFYLFSEFKVSIEFIFGFIVQMLVKMATSLAQKSICKGV